MILFISFRIFSFCEANIVVRERKATIKSSVQLWCLEVLVASGECEIRGVSLGSSWRESKSQRYMKVVGVIHLCCSCCKMASEVMSGRGCLKWWRSISRVQV